MSAPKAPDPMKTAEAQGKMNRDTAVTQAHLNMVNQSNPYGTLTYNQSGTAADGTPTFTATTALSPEQQGLFDQETATKTKAGQVANALLMNSGDRLSQMPDLSASGLTDKIMGWGRDYLQPGFDQDRSAMESRLYNQGIRQGSEAYDRAMGSLGRSQNEAYTDLLLRGQGTAMSALNQEYSLPLQTLGALGSYGAPGSVNQNLVNPPQESIAPPDYQSLVQQQYKDKLGSYNSMMSGLFSIPSTVLGGWASGGFSGAGNLFGGGGGRGG